MNEEKSYIEHCIEALPAHKQAAARQAWRSFGDGDDSTFSRMLVLLEATNALTERVPRKLLEIAGKTEADLDAKCRSFESAAQEASQKQADFIKIAIESQIPALAKSLGMMELLLESKRQGASLTRLERSVERLRHLRISRVLALMAITGIASAGLIIGPFWSSYHAGKEAREYVDALNRAAISCGIECSSPASTSVKVTFLRPLNSARWIKDANGKNIGLRLEISKSP